MIFIVSITVAIGILGWIKGFRNSDHSPMGLSLGFLSKAIHPPKFFYLLCGAPKSKTYPKGVMTAWAFLMQSLGIGLLIHTLYYTFLARSQIEVLINFICILAVAYGFTYWLTIKRAYN